jgi:UTP-glucose-1-phosphate uridylyltransferase
VAIEEVAASEVDKYGVIDGELLEGSNNAYRVHNMVEKPTPTEAQYLNYLGLLVGIQLNIWLQHLDY